MTSFPTNPFPHPPPPSRPAPIPCPFHSGEFIHELRFDTIRRDWVKDESRPDAVITEITLSGFRYEYEYPVTLVARWNWTIEGGECYPDGFRFWRNV